MPVILSPTNKMTINKFHFGNTDARSEILNRDVKKKEFFIESFYVPAKLRVDDFIEGNKYFIFGPKGTGKTALLRYINEKLNPENNLTSFVVFKEEISEDDKICMFAKNVALYDSPKHKETDLLNVWRCFLHREIVRLLEANPTFYLSSTAAEYIRLVKAIHGQSDKGLFKAILEVLKAGKIGVRVAGVGGVDAQLDLRDPTFDAKLTTTEFIRRLDNELANIKFKPNKRLYIFVDEINLAFSSTAQHERDSILIRDLIVAVAKSNEVFLQKNLNIFVLAAIRSEILAAVDTAGREIGKPLRDFGHRLDWYVERDIDKHPIIELVESKLRTNLAILDPKSPRGAKARLWDRFFDKKIYKSDSRKFVVRNTWGRPRDIVNLLSNAAEHSPNKEKFDTYAFQNSFSSFSETCWKERAQELNVFYSGAEVDTIKRVLQGFKREFTLGELYARLENTVPKDEVNARLRVTDAATMLADKLYLVGVIGQKKQHGSRKIYWNHGGRHEFNPSYVASVHQALWAELHIA